MAPASIHQRADECLEKFKLLLKIENEVQEDGKTETKNPDLCGLRTEDQLARFEMWAGNIGVFADGHASLDYRVRDNDNAKQLMIELLGTLLEFLCRASEGLNPSKTLLQSRNFSDATEVAELSASSAVSSSFQGTEPDSLTDAKPGADDPFERRLEVVERTIDRLYRLSKWIRQPSIAGQNPKAERFPITDEDGNIIDNEFQDFAFQFVSHRFPDISTRLRERLGSSIVLRRKRFLYRRSHQKKLSTRTVMVLTDKEDTSKGKHSEHDVASTIQGLRVVLEDPIEEAQNFSGGPARRIAPSQTSASRMAQSPIPIDQIDKDDESTQSTAFTNTLTNNGPLQVPEPPKPAVGSKEFECPYCCIILPLNQAKASKWRRHVMQDLEPYSCVFENCSDHKLLFRDRSEWISHMRNSHTMRWVCASPVHDSSSYFHTEQEYENHMRALHGGTFTESQLQRLKNRSKVPMAATFTECPLCGWKPSKDELKRHILTLGWDELPPEEVEKISSDRIIKHLAGHLESLSIKALPWQDLPADTKDESVESKHAEEGTDQSEEHSSAVHRSMSHLSFLELEESEETLAEMLADTKHDDHFLPAGSYDSDWGFIPREDYYGHDRDPILQTLLRKLYLDASSFTEGSSGPKLPAYLVPLNPAKTFCARSQALNDIEQALCPSPEIAQSAVKPLGFPRCFAVYGPGGMGKTQIAAQFVELHRNQFDAVLWVYAESTSKISQDFKDIAIGLELIDEDHVDAKDLSFTRDILKRWLVNPLKYRRGTGSSRKNKASWLLVFDGVEDGEILNDFWPYDGPGSILITSRNPHSWSTSMELKPFSVSEATDYLFRITGREVLDEERASAVAIAKRLGGLPLALAQMGSIIAHKSISFSEFLRRYEEREGQQELFQWTFESIKSRSSNYEHSVASVWAFDSLGKGAMLLNILSMFDPDGIPESLFTSEESEKDHPDVAELKNDYIPARNELLARSLVTGNKREKKLFVHRLVQDVSRMRMGPTQLRQAFLTCVRLISSKWPFEMLAWRHGNARWEACEELFTHVQKLKDMFPEISPSIDTFDDYGFARLLIDAGWYRHERGKPIDAVHFNNIAQGICESLKLRILENPECTLMEPSILSQLDYSLTEINHNRGCIALEINEPVSALKYHKLFNGMMIKELANKPSHNDMRLAISWNELGNSYMLNKQWSKGHECFLKSIEEMKLLKDFQPTMISLPLANIGLACWLQGKLHEADDVLIHGLRDREAAFGFDDRVSFITGRFLHALGNVRGSLGNQDEALEFHRRTLLHYKTTLGNRHHRTADVFVKVAEHNMRLHHYEMALALLDHALEAYSNSHFYLPEKARASLKRSKALRALHREDEAELELSKSFQTYSMLLKDLIRNKSAAESDRKKKPSDLTDDDLTELIAFWSK